MPSPGRAAGGDPPQLDAHPLTAALAAHNASLAAAGVSLRIERRSNRLGLRGPLPNRRGGLGLTVQRISLGLSADPAGLEEASRQLRQVLRELQAQRFDWERWGRQGSRPGTDQAPVPPPPPPGERRSTQPSHGSVELNARLQNFEQAFFHDPRRRRNPAGCRTTWTAAYLPYLRRLCRTAAADGAAPLTAALLELTLESYPLGSRSRQQCGTALAALARHLGMPLPDDWRQRAGGYGLHAARFRTLPSDRQILEQLERIPNPRWRLAYGLMATYGLRNHEIFYCDLSALAPGGDRVIRVLPTSKTGEHQVWPFQPEWVERFGLTQLGETPALLPAVTTDLRLTTLQQAGRRVAEQFRRYDLEITPYDLRHAWAVRTIHIGLPDTVAARMMGHSVSIHTRTYHHWITRRDQQQAVDAALERRNGRANAA
ncbi:MAG: site-specific integrase [Cyanobium sp.]|nr:site-specific integrase [Cyanobium sp.]